VRFFVLLFVLFLNAKCRTAWAQINVVSSCQTTVSINFTQDSLSVNRKGQFLSVSAPAPAYNAYLPAFPVLPQWDFYVISNAKPLLKNIQFQQTAFYDNIKLEYVPLPHEKNSDLISERELVTVSNAVMLAGRKLWKISLSPFRYYNKLEKLSFYGKMQFELQIDNPATVSSALNSFQENLLSKAVNYSQQDLKSYSVKQQKMLVLCHSDYIKTIEPFVKWKRQKGFSVFVETVADGVGYNSLKQIVKHYYLQKKVDFAVLVGNAENVPPVPVYGYSDNMYGCVEGDDFMPELIVGRFLVDDSIQLTGQIEKTIAYEKGEFFSDSVQYNLSASFVASAETSGESEVYDYEHLRDIAGLYFAENYSINEMYDGSQGGGDENGNPTEADFIESVNNGLSILYYTGHGTDASLLTSRFSLKNIASLSNNYQHPIGVFSGCELGDFAGNECLAGGFLNASNESGNSGFVALLASTQDQWWFPPMLGQTIFAKQHLGVDFQKSNQLGEVVAGSFVEMITTYGVYGDETVANWSIFGDPSLEVYASVPHRIVIQNDSSVELGQAEVEVEVFDRKTWLSISQNGNLLFSDSISVGKQKLRIGTVADTLSLILTACRPDCFAFQDSITVEKGAEPFYHIASIFPSKDALAVAGDSLLIQLKLENIGAEVDGAYSVSVQFAEPVSGDFGFRDVSLQNGQLVLDPFMVYLPGTINNAEKLCFSVTIEGSGFSQNIEGCFPVSAPDLRLVEVVANPTSYSLPSEIVSEGELRLLQFRLENVSEVPAQGRFEIYNDDSLIRFAQTRFAYSLMPHEDTILSSFALLCGSGNKTGNLLTEYRIINQNTETGGTFAVHKTSNCLSAEEPVEDVWHEMDGWLYSSSMAYTGNYSYSSEGGFADDSAQMRIELEFTEADSIGFWVKTSCEDSYYIGAEEYLTDFLAFSIDGVTVNRWHGETPWQHFSVLVPKGKHVFEWKYLKDFVVDQYKDAVWLDDIYFGRTSHNTVEMSTVQLICSESGEAKYPVKKSENDTLLFAPASASIFKDTLIFDCLTEKQPSFYYASFGNGTNELIRFQTSATVPIEAGGKSFLYPTVSLGHVFVNSQCKLDYEIVSVDGRLIKKGGLAEGRNRINLTDLMPGLYLFRSGDGCAWFLRK